MTRTRRAEPPLARVGLFGGTFDPPHVGHVSVVKEVADALGLQLVLWMPAGDPPHKERPGLTPAPVRLAMTRAAASADARFEVSTLEIDRAGPSYTVDTLRELELRLGGAELFVILGVDQYRDLDGWREPREILRRARVAVMDRAGDSARATVPAIVGEARTAAAAAGAPDPVVFVPVTRVDVSSTGVREAVRRGGNVHGLVPEAVLDIIEGEGLYRAEAPGPGVGP